MTQFTFYTPENSQGEAQKILQNIEKQYGFVPNLFAYMAEAPYLIEAYIKMNELLGKSNLSNAQQQIALLAVSAYNNCEFCKVAHRAFGKMHKASNQTLMAIVDGTEIEDQKDRALVAMLHSILDNRGWVKDEDLDAFFAAGFDKKNVYDLILVVSIKTLSNYSNHLSLPEANEELVAML
jgi:uncharacterized peroxidase-related enzyme